jgi:aldehyde dehydrogenase (NAD+)
MATAVSEAGFAAMQADRAINDSKLADRLSEQYAQMVAEMRGVFESGRTKSVEWRRRQLQGLRRGIEENHEAIKNAIMSDLGGYTARAIFDMAPTCGDIDYALANLNQWTRPKTVKNDLPIDFQSTYTVRPEPKGVTLNIAPWNFPMGMCFQPLVPALAAGNMMVIKPSEMAPATASIIEHIVTTYLDNDAVKVVQGAVAETTALLAQRWDHIFYTGNGVVGRIVMQAAAKNLTPITLELGGKSPVIVDKTANMATVVNRVFMAKALNAGQVCVSPDYVLIHESREAEFHEAFAKQVEKSNFGNGSKGNKNWGKIINSRHAERLKRLIETSGGEAVTGGSAEVDADARHVPLTVLKGVKPDSPIMYEEIFGPVLPVVPVKDMEEGIQMIKDREKPLALYVYSQDRSFQEKVLQECTSGGACVNASLEQLANKEAPFGGVGASGMGAYHGKKGFDEFSHHRTILYKTGSNPTLPPPEQHPDWLYDVMLKATVTGFLTETQRQLLKVGATGALGLAAAAVVRSRL